MLGSFESTDGQPTRWLTLSSKPPQADPNTGFCILLASALPKLTTGSAISLFVDMVVFDVSDCDAENSLFGVGGRPKRGS
jgi:hypothetical protein